MAYDPALESQIFVARRMATICSCHRSWRVKPDNGKKTFQTTPGDTWDFASTQPLILADLTINGRLRKVIMQAAKNGFFYVLDRITGEFFRESSLSNA